MLRLRTSLILLTLNAAAIPAFLPASAGAQSAPASGSAWTFAVSGDSRNCGDFVVPAIAAKVKAENDAFYWHLGDFRWISQPDQDLLAMLPAGSELSKADYRPRAWDDFVWLFPGVSGPRQS